MNAAALLGVMGLVALMAPFTAALVTGVPWIFGFRASESTVRRTTATAFLVAFVASLGIDLVLIARPGVHQVVTLTHWMVLPSYVLDARLVFDAPAAMLMTLTAMLVGLIGAFSAPYLHRDPGFHRFFVLLPLFATGMMAVAAADTLDLLYAGWEVVGLTSALLISYFTQREAAVRHGLRAFAVYRVCDVALLSAAILLHHAEGDPAAAAHGTVAMSTGVALLLVFASLGKAAAFPFTGWLPRAMEGPTPSSAIFYGALSIHAGPYLLIRTWPLIEGEPIARAALVVIGLVTAAHATMVGRVQTDVKCVYGYASVTQAAVILIEIGLGFTTLALVHIAGHATLRTWQLLRAPSVIQDHFALVGMIGGGRPPRGTLWERLLPASLQRFGYRLALERWFMDDLAALGLVAGLKSILHRLDAGDRYLGETLAGTSVGEER